MACVLVIPSIGMMRNVINVGQTTPSGVVAFPVGRDTAISVPGGKVSMCSVPLLNTPLAVAFTGCSQPLKLSVPLLIAA